jgi:hypothetical protein
MATFTDARGKRNTITLNVWACEQVLRNVKDAEGNPVNLYQIGDESLLKEDGLFVRLLNDVGLRCQVIHCLIGGSFEEFAQAMDGDAVAAASEALVEEIINFTPPSKRQAIQKVWRKATALDLELTRKLETLIDSPEMDAEIRKNLEPHGKRSGGSPDSSGSTPDRSPSASSSPCPTPPGGKPGTTLPPSSA